MRSYLRLTRAHTAPLEAVPAAVGALVATGGNITLGVAIWTIYGVLYHLTGYGMNSYTDWVLGHDKDDPHKQHHPLNSGVMTKELAKITLWITAIITVGVGFYGAYIGHNSIAVLLIILSGVLFGSTYNVFSKSTELKPIFIALAHSTVFLAPYVAMGGGFDYIGITGTSLVIIWVIFQIGFSGELKDIDVDDTNLLKSIFKCNSYGDRVDITPETYLFASTLRFGILVAYGTVAYTVSGLGASLAVAVLGVVAMLQTKQMVFNASFDFKRRAVVRNMAIVEYLTLAMFVFTYSGIIGEMAAGVLVASGAIWVLTLNRIQWGRWIAPAV